MNKTLLDILYIGIIGFFAAWVGLSFGIVLSFFTKNRGRRFKGSIIGFIGGLMLSIICFDILPESIESGDLYLATSGVLIGLLTAALLDGKLEEKLFSPFSHNKNHLVKASLFMAIGIGIHNFPGGVALGSLLYISYVTGLHLVIILIIHGVPEGLNIGMFLRDSSIKLPVVLMISLLTSLPMAFGAVLGAKISNISPSIISSSLAFAAGLMLYVICRETLPESRETWKGRLSAIGNVLGLISGIVLVSFIH